MTAAFGNRPQTRSRTDDSVRSQGAIISSRPADQLPKIALGLGIAMTLAWIAFLGWCLNSFLNLI